MQDIIGRKSERKELDRLYESGRPEFVAVYGRRRVGKTFLVREHFSGRFAFYHTAISPADFQGKKKDLKKEQLRAFCSSIQQFGGDWDEMPNDWFEAFACLREILEQRGETGRKVVFIDELPWMDSGRSGFVAFLEQLGGGPHRPDAHRLRIGGLVDERQNHQQHWWTLWPTHIRNAPFAVQSG